MPSVHDVEIETLYPASGTEWAACCSCGWESSASSGKNGVEYAESARAAHRRVVEDAGEPVRTMFHGTSQEFGCAIVADRRLNACWVAPTIDTALRYAAANSPAIVQLLLRSSELELTDKALGEYFRVETGTIPLDVRVLSESDDRMITARTAAAARPSLFSTDATRAAEERLLADWGEE